MTGEARSGLGQPVAALLDACVLYPVTLRDMLLRAAERELCRPLWSAEILGELARSLVTHALAKPEHVDRLVQAMQRAFPAAQVGGYQRLVRELHNHPKDRHVRAAALVGGADVVVTSNVRHCKDDEIVPSRVAVQTPDEFLCHLFASAPETLREIVRDQARTFTRPALTAADVIGVLERHAPVVAERIRSEVM